MTEPRTAAGRAYLQGQPWLGRAHEAVLAIEAEARAAAIDDLAPDELVVKVETIRILQAKARAAALDAIEARVRGERQAIIDCPHCDETNDHNRARIVVLEWTLAAIDALRETP